MKHQKPQLTITFTPCSCAEDLPVMCDWAKAAIVVEPDPQKAAKLFLLWKATADERWERGGSKRYGIICVPNCGHVWSVQ